MLIATWNLNNRAGCVPFRPEAARAAIALGADVVVFNEYFPKGEHETFCASLRDAGWLHHEMSLDTGVRANRILIASRMPLEPLEIALPRFDRQFPSNLLGVRIPSIGVSILGVRVPWYGGQSASLTISAWDWLETFAADKQCDPWVILGDMNVGLHSSGSRGGDHFRRILASGWQRATPSGTASFLGARSQTSEIDHILGSPRCEFSNARYITESGGYVFAGGNGSLSDHAALMADVDLRSQQTM